MRIAFTSCFNARRFKDQPVWDWIREKKPSHMVLLGDSIYLDDPQPTPRVEAMNKEQFKEHIHDLYTRQINQSQFKALVESMETDRIWSIWDDHDFLWNDAVIEELRGGPDLLEKVAVSTAYQEAFRKSLSMKLATGSFPATSGQIQPAKGPLSTRTIPLPMNTVLHLPDSRTFRTPKYLTSKKSAMTTLGNAQKLALEMAFKAHPDAIHIFASSSVLKEYDKDFPTDMAWLTSLAAQYKTLVISGDIHKNKLMSYPTGHFRLYEATSSGAAVHKWVIAGKEKCNYGLLDINDQSISISLFAQNELETAFSLKIDRASWNAEAI